MTKKYFDNWEFKQIIPLIETDPYEAKLKFEEYLKEYPKDYSVYPFYISTLITIRELNAATNLLEYLTKLINNDTKYLNNYKNKNRIIILNEHILTTKLKLLLYQDKFDELNIFCMQNEQAIKNLNLNYILFYNMKQNNNIINNKREPNSYKFRQIVEYQEEDFLEHIKKHLPEYINNSTNESVFSINFPINEIINEIKKYLSSNNALYFNFLEDTYIFKYDNCGKANNKYTDYFKVICFHNTSNIITMYPSSNNCQNLPSIDLNYLIQNKINLKTKKLSQIDKFNQKYNFK